MSHFLPPAARGDPFDVTIAGLIAVGACSCTRDAETAADVGGRTLWAGGGFACLQTDGFFDCRDHWKAVSFSMHNACVVREDGTGACFGSDNNHSVDVPEGTWTMIVQAGGQACGLHPDGSVTCWGNGAEGFTPPAGPFVDVQAMDGAACARDEGGTITCWGNDYQGNVVSPAGTWASFILPNSFLCMLDAEGRIACAGYGEVANADLPSGTGYHPLTGGFGHACALNTEDRAVCWGRDKAGLLDAPDDAFVQLASGSYFTCGLKENGDVLCWGCREEAAPHPERYCDWDNPAPWWVP